MYNLKPNDIPPAPVMCPNDEWENAIRKFGVQNACEWFGYDGKGGWAKETAKILSERQSRQDNFYNK